MSDLGIPRFFLDTFNARHNKLSIDFAWSGSIFQMKPSKLLASWNTRKIIKDLLLIGKFFLSYLKLEDSFSFGVKCLDRNPRVPKYILKEIKHRWCNCLEELEGALN